MRLTDYDKLQLKLREYADRKAANGEIELANGILKAKCFIDQECEVIEEKQLTNGWIPVSERLPEQRQHEGGEPVEFNVMLLGGIVPTTGCINNEGIWGWMDWEDYKFIPIGVEVLYWRPLPEPPKEVYHD